MLSGDFTTLIQVSSIGEHSPRGSTLTLLGEMGAGSRDESNFIKNASISQITSINPPSSGAGAISTAAPTTYHPYLLSEKTRKITRPFPQSYSKSWSVVAASHPALSVLCSAQA